MPDIANYEQLSDSVYFVESGSPHHVEFVSVDQLPDVDVEGRGRTVRHSEMYRARGGSNVNWAAWVGGELRLRTYERGVETEMLGCGTGAVAAAVAHYLRQSGSGQQHQGSIGRLAQTDNSANNFSVNTERMAGRPSSDTHSLADGSGRPIGCPVRTLVSVRGGELTVVFTVANRGSFEQVSLTGPCHHVFSGIYYF